jgi:hypothetical protein
VKIFVAILLIAAVPAYAQAQTQSTPKVTKGDAQKVATTIRSDKAKIQTYCEINKVSDKKTVDELSQKIDRLEKILGPEYVALMDGLRNSVRKTASALRRFCFNSPLSTGCVRGKSLRFRPWAAILLRTNCAVLPVQTPCGQQHRIAHLHKERLSRHNVKLIRTRWRADRISRTRGNCVTVVERIFNIGREKLLTIIAFALVYNFVWGWLTWIQALPSWHASMTK